MNRKYDSTKIRERVAALRSAIPDISITTDFLIGFPGESEEQFDNTLRLAEEIRFDAAFMFAFNPIPRTAAATMEDQISEQVKNERLNRLIKLQNTITCEINDASIGRTYDVLVENVSPKDPKRITGLTRQNKTVNFAGTTTSSAKTVPIPSDGRPSLRLRGRTHRRTMPCLHWRTNWTLRKSHQWSPSIRRSRSNTPT